MNTQAVRTPHMPHPTHGFMMPVKLDFTGKVPKPLRRDGHLAYALPGGGEYVMIESRSDINP